MSFEILLVFVSNQRFCFSYLFLIISINEDMKKIIFHTMLQFLTSFMASQ